MGLKITITVICLGIVIAYQLIDQFDPETVRGKNVIITGASTGIGEHMAYHYAQLGANILIMARREHRLQKVVENCRKFGHKDGKYYFISLDMMDQTAPDRLIKYAEKVLDGIDYLVLNHVLEYHVGDWLGSRENFTELEKTFTINFNAYVGIASQALPHLELRQGSIIVMSSVGGKMPMPRFASYTASKHALQVSSRGHNMHNGEKVPLLVRSIPNCPLCSLLSFNIVKNINSVVLK